MNVRRLALVPVCALSLVAFGTLAAPAAAEEVKGAAILDHACGKTSLKHMGLVHAGKMAEAVKLGTPEMQKEWSALPAEQREMMTGMMKEMSKSEADFAADIKAFGELVVDGKAATLTVTKKTEDASGSGTETMTQKFAIEAKGCWITR
jgi:hypothetical protein